MESPSKKSFSLQTWSTRDILTLAAIVGALAVVSAISAYARTGLEAAFGPIGNRIVMVINIFVLFVPPYFIRRPLTAVLASVLIGVILLPVSPFGLISLVGYLVGGIITELIFATGRYRTYSARFLIIGGIVYNAITLGLIWIPLQVGALGTIGLLGMIIGTLVGGALGGWLTKRVGDAVQQSGVLAHQLEAEEEI
ncbi:MAG: ECF transporter S component [Chloroflexota bacterium]